MIGTAVEVLDSLNTATIFAVWRVQLYTDPSTVGKAGGAQKAHKPLVLNHLHAQLYEVPYRDEAAGGDNWKHEAPVRLTRNT